MSAFEDFPFRHAWAVTTARETQHAHGDVQEVFALASVSKLITALAVLIAVDRSLIDLQEPAGPPGATVGHLLAHTAGYSFDGSEPVAEPGSKRIYSNTGFEVLAEHVAEHIGYDFPEWVEQEVLLPLGMVSTEVTGSPAAGYRANIADLVLFARELLAPTLISTALHTEALSVQFPGLVGIVPGYGRHKPCDWGWGFEIRDHKNPHWTASTGSPRTVGHFGQSGSFLWMDPEAKLSAVFLGTEPFGETHKELWPRLNDQILQTFASSAMITAERSGADATGRPGDQFDAGDPEEKP